MFLAWQNKDTENQDSQCNAERVDDHDDPDNFDTDDTQAIFDLGVFTLSFKEPQNLRNVVSSVVWCTIVRRANKVIVLGLTLVLVLGLALVL